jgi:hypothetical protein
MYSKDGNNTGHPRASQKSWYILYVRTSQNLEVVVHNSQSQQIFDYILGSIK